MKNRERHIIIDAVLLTESNSIDIENVMRAMNNATALRKSLDAICTELHGVTGPWSEAQPAFQEMLGQAARLEQRLSNMIKG